MKLRVPALLLCSFMFLAHAASAEVVRVASGDSIAAAIEAAAPGTIIEVEPGIYHEALTVDTPGITLRGIVQGDQRPILDGRNKLNDGVIASGSPFEITGFAIRHYKGNGVTTQGVDGARFDDLEIDDTGLYGVYPVQSRNITVTNCTITRIKDAGIYVGDSVRALVAYNEVHHNVAGIEIENTNDAVVRDNLTFDNTAGILVFVLPGKVQKEALRNHVYRNWVVRNNGDNFGDPVSTVGQLPPGIGVLVMGADQTVVENNWIKDNRSVGIGLVRLGPTEAARDPEQEPFADRNRIGRNYLSGNGLDPDPSIVEGYGGGGDFAWDGTGVDNCAILSDAATTNGAPLRRCPSGNDRSETDAAVPLELLGGGHLFPPETPQTSNLPGRGPAPQVAPPVADARVRIRGMRFEPRHVTVAAGATVAWSNEDAVAHTVTSGEGPTPTHSPLSSRFLMRGDHYSHVFSEPGIYEYLCLPHLDQAPMRGATVTVVAPEPS